MSSQTPHPRTWLGLHCVLVAITVLAMGCELERRVVKENPWDRMFRESEWNDSTSSTRNGGRADPNSRGYAVELGTYSGGEAFRLVSQMMQSARAEGGLANLWCSSSGQQTTIYAGRFKQRDSSEAKTVLKQARAAKIDGKKPFEDAEIVALRAQREEVLDPNDLRTLKGRGLYALQIGYYDAEYGPNFRRAAETAAKVLREADQEAYYYHGPRRSMVLLNAWTRSEAFTLVGQQDRYSNAVRAVQEKHPHNIPNGRPFTKDDDPVYVKTQHSFLVPIR